MSSADLHVVECTFKRGFDSFVATPPGALDDVAVALKGYGGIIASAMVPGAGGYKLKRDDGTSAAEQLARLVPTGCVVTAFTSISSALIRDPPRGDTPTVFTCADDEAARSNVINATSQDISGLVGEKEVKALPLNGRSYDLLLTLNPGIVNFTSEKTGGIGESNSTTGSNFAVSGNRPQQNLFLLNGVEFTGAAENNMTPGGPSQNLIGVEAVREFNVLRDNYGAEYGKRPGAQVIIVTQSGTNQFHGSVYEYLRNNALDAPNYFDLGSAPPAISAQGRVRCAQEGPPKLAAPGWVLGWAPDQAVARRGVRGGNHHNLFKFARLREFARRYLPNRAATTVISLVCVSEAM